MGLIARLLRKQKKPASNIPAKNAIARLSEATHETRVPIAVKLLRTSDYEVKAAVASEIGRLKIRAVGVWYELANALADDHEFVRLASAKAFWQLEGVGYAIRSLRDEHENPANMSKESALRGIRTLMETASEKINFENLLKENWQDCPIHKRKLEEKIRDLAMSDDEESLVELARLASQAVRTKDLDKVQMIRSELRTHVDIARFSHAIRTRLSKSEQDAILQSILKIKGNQDMEKKCAHCGSRFFEPKSLVDKLNDAGMQKVRVGCSKCGTPVCFSCAATEADKRGKKFNCFCPKCGAELGKGGEAGNLGDHFSGWN